MACRHIKKDIGSLREKRKRDNGITDDLACRDQVFARLCARSQRQSCEKVLGESAKEDCDLLLRVTNRAAQRQVMNQYSGEVIVAEASTEVALDGHWAEKRKRQRPSFRVLGSSDSLEMAKELALECFKDVHGRSGVPKFFPNLRYHPSDYEQEPSFSLRRCSEGVWIGAGGDVRGASRLAWWVDNISRNALRAAMPDTSSQISVWVTRSLHISCGMPTTLSPKNLSSWNASTEEVFHGDVTSEGYSSEST
jgi:hypothetical protein